MDKRECGVESNGSKCETIFYSFDSWIEHIKEKHPKRFKEVTGFS